MSAPESHTTTDAALSSLMGAVIGSPETSAPVASVKTAQSPYGSPADVSQRIEAWIAAHGQQDAASLLLYEAMKALRRRAPAAGDAQMASQLLPKLQSLLDRMANDPHTGALFEADGDTLRDAMHLCRSVNVYAAIAQQSVRKGE